MPFQLLLHTFDSLHVYHIQLEAFGVPPNSPLRRSHSAFWSIRLNDEGVVRDDHFFTLVNTGKIELAAPARATGYAEDGSGIVLHDGVVLPADAVILATGYSSSWEGLFEGFHVST